MKINKIMAKSSDLSATPDQLKLDLGIEVERSVGGIEMGVLENGMPYLTQRGLSAMSGAARATIFEITQEWETGRDGPIAPRSRLAFLQDYLSSNGFDHPKLYVEILKNGSPYYAYPDIVCMAILEYYAFEAQRTNPTALENYRSAARYGLSRYIYDSLGYTPPDKWRYYNDRVSILQSSAPDGHFIVFHEISGMIVDLINAGLTVNDKTIPDISVGRSWSDHWKRNSLSDDHGERISFEHNYPGYYPQAASNPQTPWAYPDTSLPEFRRWFRFEYLPTKFPPYVLKKANVLRGGKDEAKAIAAIYEGKRLPKPKRRG